MGTLTLTKSPRNPALTLTKRAGLDTPTVTVIDRGITTHLHPERDHALAVVRGIKRLYEYEQATDVHVYLQWIPYGRIAWEWQVRNGKVTRTLF